MLHDQPKKVNRNYTETFYVPGAGVQRILCRACIEEEYTSPRFEGEERQDWELTPTCPTQEGGDTGERVPIALDLMDPEADFFGPYFLSTGYPQPCDNSFPDSCGEVVCMSLQNHSFADQVVEVVAESLKEGVV
jgi:hypothetical protein